MIYSVITRKDILLFARLLQVRKIAHRTQRDIRLQYRIEEILRVIGKGRKREKRNFPRPGVA